MLLLRLSTLGPPLSTPAARLPWPSLSRGSHGPVPAASVKLGHRSFHGNETSSSSSFILRPSTFHAVAPLPWPNFTDDVVSPGRSSRRRPCHRFFCLPTRSNINSYRYRALPQPASTCTQTGEQIPPRQQRAIAKHVNCRGGEFPKTEYGVYPPKHVPESDGLRKT